MIWRRAAIAARAGAYAFRESLFPFPTLLVFGGIAGSELAAAVDARIAGAHLPLAFNMSSNAATWLLSIVAGATITTAGVVFSLTVVSLQLASSQFSPRVMRSFIRDRLSQWVVGLLIATFVYCVLVLRTVSGEPTDPAPPVSLTLAVLLSVATVMLIIAHLNHLAQRLQVGQVVRAIAEEGAAVVQAVLVRGATEQAASGIGYEQPPEALVIPALRDGWVTQSASDDILAAVPAGSTVRLETRAGAYIHAGEPLAALWPVPERTGAVARRLSQMVVVGHSRTMQEDIDFAIRQLVDIGLRALSSAINDPNTAVEVVLRLGSLLRRILPSPLPPNAVQGPEGRVLLRPWELNHEEYLAHAFDQLRHLAPAQPQVAATMMRTLQMLQLQAEEAGNPRLSAAVGCQLRMLLEALDRQPGIHPADLERLHLISSTTTDPAEHRIGMGTTERPGKPPR